MKKRVLVTLVLGMLLVFPLVQAQTYSGFTRFTDNVKLLFSGGDRKVKLALEVREKEVDSALENVRSGYNGNAVKNLEKAKQKLQIVREKVSLETTENTKESVEEVTNKINNEENLPEQFNEYILEEEKTLLTAVLTEKTYEYCKELATEDFSLMLGDEECNPETAPEPLKEDLAKLKDLQERMFVKLMLEIRSCIDDPGTCNCEKNLDAEEKARCEKMVALAVKCEYKDDEIACDELESMEPTKGDGFAESFVPDFLMNLFREKESKMINYEIEPSCGVPEECWDENDKPECKQYEHLKETSADWDEYGNYIGHERECDEQIPTMKESIPQCFDENDNFLEEKCGGITIIKNEEGLINYIVEKEIDHIIDEFENKSQNTIDKGNWTVDENGLEVSNKAREIKQEMNEVKNQIAERSFAPGTYDTGDSGTDVKTVVIEEGEGDDGLKPEVKTDIEGGGSGGDDGLEPEVKTDVAEGTEKDEPLPEPDLNQINPDIAPQDTTTNHIDEGDGGQGDYAEGTTAEGSNTVDP